MCTMTVEARRVYVKTPFGHPVVAKLKSLGAHWDGERKQWWLGSGKKSEVEALLASPANDAYAPNPAEDTDKITVVGKAKYKGKTYYVRWVGETKSGEYKARLVTLDAKIDFWAKCARPHERHVDGSGDVAAIVKTYPAREERGAYGRPTGRMVQQTLGGIRRFIEQARNETPEQRSERELVREHGGRCRCSRPVDEGDGSCIVCGYAIV